jgi:hypothetical protein
MQTGIFRASDAARRWLVVLCVGAPLLVLAMVGPKRPRVVFAAGELAGEPVPAARLAAAVRVGLIGADSVAIETGLLDEEYGRARSSRSNPLVGVAAAAPPPMPRLIVPSLDRDRSSFGLDTLAGGLEAPSLGSGELAAPSWGWLADDYFSAPAPPMPAAGSAAPWGINSGDPRDRMDPMRVSDPFQQPGLSDRRGSYDWMDR